jgi:hypothetical protein
MIKLSCDSYKIQVAKMLKKYPKSMLKIEYITPKPNNHDKDILQSYVLVLIMCNDMCHLVMES